MDPATQHIKPGGVVAYGPAVYQARAILAVVNDTVYDDFDLCAEQGYALKTDPFSEEVEDSAIIKEYYVRPNPAKGSLYVGLKEGVFSDEQVLLLNYLGQEVLAHKPLQLHIDRIDISTLPSGIYTLVVIREGVKQFKEKVVIQH